MGICTQLSAEQHTDFPISFSGTLPCADCDGIETRINLFGDGVFRSALTYLGRESDGPNVSVFYDMGQWEADADTPSSVRLLTDEEGMNLFTYEAGTGLTMLASDGTQIASSLNYTLPADEPFELLPMALYATGLLGQSGHDFTFAECKTGVRFPIHNAGAIEELRALRSGLPPESEILVSLFSLISPRPSEGPGSPMIDSVTAGLIVGASASADCAAALKRPPLTGTTWRLVSLNGEAVDHDAVGQAVTLTFSSPVDEARVAAETGCNIISGGYNRNGASLTIGGAGGALLSTWRACPPAVAELETNLSAALIATRSWVIEAQFLQLSGENSVPLAVFEAVPAQ